MTSLLLLAAFGPVIPKLLLQAGNGQERVIYRNGLTTKELAVPKGSTVHNLWLTNKGRTAIVLTSPFGGLYVWHPHQGKCKHYNPEYFEPVIVGLTSSGTPIAATRHATGMWKLAYYHESKSKYIPRGRTQTLGGILTKAWWPDTPDISRYMQTEVQAGNYLSGGRKCWLSGNPLKLFQVNERQLVVNGKVIWDTGPGGRVISISGNQRYVTATAVYFENPAGLWEPGVRNHWTDSTEKRRQEVYAGVLIDASTNQVVEYIDGSARVEVTRG